MDSIDKIKNECWDLIVSLSEHKAADIDDEDESKEIQEFKEFIIKARTLLRRKEFVQKFLSIKAEEYSPLKEN